MVAPNQAEPVWQPHPPQPEIPGETEVGLDGAPIETTENPVAPPEQRAAPAARRYGGARRASSSSLLLVVSALVALGGIGFAVGRATSSGQSDTSQSNVANASFVPGDFSGLARAAAGSTTVSGTVVSVSADSITLKLANGQTVQVATGSSTTYHGQSAAAITDVTTGASVTVQTAAGPAAGPAAGSSAGTNAGASPGALNGTRTATDVTITAK